MPGDLAAHLAHLARRELTGDGLPLLADRVHKNLGPCPGCSGAAHAQFGFPHLRQFSLTDPRRKSLTTLSCANSRSRSASSSGSDGSDMALLIWF